MSRTEPSEDLNYWPSPTPTSHPPMAYLREIIMNMLLNETQTLRLSRLWQILCSFGCAPSLLWASILIGLSSPFLLPDSKVGISSHHAGEDRKRRRGKCDAVTISHTCQNCCSSTAVSSKLVVSGVLLLLIIIIIYFLPFLAPHLSGVWVWRAS